MSPETLFSAANLLALLGWVLLLLLPTRPSTIPIVRSGIVLLLSAFYLFLILRFFGRTPGGFGSLAEVQQLFGQPFLLLAGWVHYLAFDLLIGTYILEDLRARDSSLLWRFLSLPLTFMFGPAGLLVHRATLLLARGKLRFGGAS